MPHSNGSASSLQAHVHGRGRGTLLFAAASVIVAITSGVAIVPQVERAQAATSPISLGGTAQSRLPSKAALGPGIPQVLTKRGLLLWNFEGLLKQTFGNQTPSMYRETLDFSCAATGGCAPKATYGSFGYAFSQPANSTFHLGTTVSAQQRPNQNRMPILIRHRLILCNPAGTRYLIRMHVAATFTFACAGLRTSRWADRADPQVRARSHTSLAPHEAPLRRANAPVAGLTAEGRLLWNYEALLRHTYGLRQPLLPCMGICDGNCSVNCSKLVPYRYVFSHGGASTFHRTNRSAKGVFFGNYPSPIPLSGRLIACDPAGRTMLIMYDDAATFTLGCLPPQPSPR